MQKASTINNRKGLMLSIVTRPTDLEMFRPDDLAVVVERYSIQEKAYVAQ